MSRRQYRKGPKIDTLDEFACRVQEGKPLYWKNKFMAAGYIIHWSFIMVLKAIKTGYLWTAEKIEPGEVFQDEKISFVEMQRGKLYAEYEVVMIYFNKKQADNKARELRMLGYDVVSPEKYPFMIALEEE